MPEDMKKRGRGNTGLHPGAGKDVEAAVRAAARSIAERFETAYPHFEDLADDEEFLSAGDLLVDPEVTFATVARLARGSQPILAAMAHRAASIRDDVPEEWVEWGFRRLKQAYAGEVLFLLRAIERHGKPPYIARVLARADHDWTEGWLNSVVGAFVERCIEAGERPTANDFEEAVKEPDEELVAQVVASLDGVLPEETVREFHSSRERRARITFFQSFARIWERHAEPALATVGGRRALIDELRALVGGQDARSALVVGEHGLGKSAVIREALRELQDDGRFVFEASAADVHAGRSYVGQLEGRVHEIVAQLSDERAVWVMPTFEDALWAGQHSRSERGLLDALRPFVETGQLVIVGELEPRAYELLVQQRPRVTDLFATLRLEPLTSEEAIAVARDWREHAGVDIDDTTIRDAQDLAAQYLAGAGSPAGVLRLLKAAAADASAGQPIRLQQILETLAGATGLPLHVVDPEAPLDLGDVRQFFSTRVLGQQEAVDCLVDRIALIKAKLTDPTRPLGVFLFVGPTGTGKTELAKVLAEFLFGSPERLVRLDMSEFQTEDSMERLLADSSSQAEAATLISSVRAKPFSVVLLDEFEKAHRNFWNVFLQLFDDGRLTDRQGRTADFRQCVVILTSNVGSALDSGMPLGFGRERGAQFSSGAVQRELSRVFRPELLNRIDRIVVFRPFEREQMRALLERELELVLERRGFRDRPWVVEWDEAALDLLLRRGFSAELGARPLKRAVEQLLLAPLAAAIVSRSFPEGDQFLFVTARDDRIEVEFVDPDAAEEEPTARPASTASLRLDRLVLSPGSGPAETGFLQAETARIRGIVDGEGWHGRKERDLEAMRSKAFWDSPERFTILGRIEYVDRVEALLRTAEKLSARLARPRRGAGTALDLVQLLAQRLFLLDHACTAADASAPADAFLEIRWPTVDRTGGVFALQLRDMYEAWAKRRGMRVRRLKSGSSHLLAVSGIAAHPILATEAGLHVFETPRTEHSFGRVAVRVAVAPSSPAPPEADPAVLARDALDRLPASATVVRRYRTDPSPLVRDSVHDWRTGRLDRVLAGEFDVMDAG